MGGEPAAIRTFVFTDIEGSTRRWVELGDAMAEAVARHDDIVLGCVAEHGGTVFATGGDGFAIAFDEPAAAVRAAASIQSRLDDEEFDAVGGLAIRIGIHTGAAEVRGGDFFGPEVARAARIGAAGHGGQVLLSAAAAGILDVPTRDLGPHRLRDFPEPESIHQLATDGMAGQFPPLRTLEDKPSTLPSPRSAFFGRRDEIDRVRRLLHQHRLVTLTGVGGTGKTRLATETAWEELPNRPGGAYFVDLTSATDADGVIGACIAGTVERAPGGEARRQLIAHFASLDAVLVIDNCEHVLDESADLVEDLLDHCPELRIIVTSREPLDVDGEQIIRIPSLTAVEGASVGPAVRLFVDRARAADTDVDLESEAPVITEICERLDGIPLAIELAAARTRVLAPSELLERLGDRFSLLTGSRRRRGHQRQKTLEAAVAWSYDLLDEDEQRSFRALAVLERGFDLAAAASVIDADEVTTVDIMDSLVAKSLVVHDALTGRFALLETLRQYGEERLVEAGEADGVRARHLAHFRQLVRRPEWAIDDQKQMARVVRQVDRERSNLIAALEWAEETADDRALVELVLGCGTELAYGHLGNTRWLDAAIEHAERLALDPRDRAGLLFDRISIAVIALDTSTWSSCAKEGRRLLQDDHPILVGLLSAHGFLRMADAPELTVERCQAAIEMGQRLGLLPTSRWMRLAHSQFAIGLVGLRRYREAAELIGGLGPIWTDDDNRATLDDGASAMALPAILHLLGRTDEGLRIMETVSFRTGTWQMPIAGIHAALLAGAGRCDDAVARLLEATEMKRSEGVALATDNVVLGFGAVRARRGETDRARALADVCAGYRTPASLVLLVELVAGLEEWADDEFIERRRAFVMQRFVPDWAERTESRRAELLAEEVEFFRGTDAHQPTAGAGGPRDSLP